MSFSKPTRPPEGVEPKQNADGTENAKYIDLLDEDKSIAGQKFACLSFISPETFISENNNETVSFEIGPDFEKGWKWLYVF